MIGPFIGRAAAAVKALTEQAQPFDEALLGDLALEHQLLDRARYIKALAVAGEQLRHREARDPADHRPHGDGDWLTTVLAEDALGGPAALRRTPLQAAAGTAIKLVNVPVVWSAQRNRPRPRHRPLGSAGAERAAQPRRSLPAAWPSRR